MAKSGAFGTGFSIADANFGINAQSILPNVNDNNSLQNAKTSEPFTASGSFMDAKSNSIGGGPAATTSDILFLKRLLFLKAALDNDQTLSNFAVPFDEDKAFNLHQGEVRPPALTHDAVRAGVQTAPAGINNRRDRLN